MVLDPWARKSEKRKIFFSAFIAELKTRVDFKVSSCLSQTIATNLDHECCHHTVVITTTRHLCLCLAPLLHHWDCVATLVSACCRNWIFLVVSRPYTLDFHSCIIASSSQKRNRPTAIFLLQAFLALLILSKIKGVGPSMYFCDC